MLKINQPPHGLLFLSFLYRNDIFNPENLTSFCEQELGPGFVLFPEKNPLVQYYSKEMGENLSRLFFLTSKSFPREFLLSTKLLALGWEKSWAKEGKRLVNVDVGFLSAENFILATTKNYAHRVYLGQGIFADLTYFFSEGEFKTLPWTYPDYVDSQKIEFFTWGRSFLLRSFHT